MPSLWFIVPVHGRLPLASICLRQLRRTCDALTENGVDANAVIIANDLNLLKLGIFLEGTLGFWAIQRDNKYLSRKFNDGIQLACEYADADFVVPFGSDDWADWRLFTDLPPRNTIYGFQAMSFVREDGLEMEAKAITYPGGSGIRIYPRYLMEKTDFRPAAEDLPRGCDTSILHNVQRSYAYTRLIHCPLDPRQLVDWKSRDQQLNTYKDLRRHKTISVTEPFAALADVYSSEALEEMAAHYKRLPAVAA